MECFGSDDEEEESTALRPPTCGICSFHPHTESSLLSHVRNSLASAEVAMAVDSMDVCRAKILRAERVLNSVDEFCISRHWMMHVGPEKGNILTTTLKESIDKKLSMQPSNNEFVVVELGSYCGYSSILMAKECLIAHESNKLNFKLITLEINSEYIAVATELIKLSGLVDDISLLEISFNGHYTNVVGILQDELNSNYNEQQQGGQLKTIDLLFIDHDKDSYKSDLMKLEASGLICRGTRIVADNVLFAQIDEYLRYVQMRQSDGVVTTRTVPCHVEYSNVEAAEETTLESVSDGIGKSFYQFCHFYFLPLCISLNRFGLVHLLIMVDVLRDYRLSCRSLRSVQFSSWDTLNSKMICCLKQTLHHFDGKLKLHQSPFEITLPQLIYQGRRIASSDCSFL
jgi:catechol O-methyltransferase